MISVLSFGFLYLSYRLDFRCTTLNVVQGKFCPKTFAAKKVIHNNFELTTIFIQNSSEDKTEE